MTCFPIAVGTGPRQSSSLPFPKFESSNIESDADVVMTMGNNADDSLAATLFIKYHFLPARDIDNERDGTENGTLDNHVSAADDETTASQIDSEGVSRPNTNSSEFAVDSNNGHHPDSSKTFNVIAELRVQIQSSTAPFTSNVDAMTSRETKCRVPMGLLRRRGRMVTTSSEHGIQHQNSNDYDSSQSRCSEKKLVHYRPIASVIFSSNESHLACLIPLPEHHEPVSPTLFPSFGNDPMATSAMSIVVIFSIQSQLLTAQQKMRQQRRILPPLPNYVMEKSIDDTRDSKEESRTRTAEENDEEVKPNIHHEEGNFTKATSDAGADDTSAPTNQRLKFRPPRRDLYSYAPHQPKIVRVPHELSMDPSEENHSFVPQNSNFFQRKLSKGSFTPTVPPSRPLQSATTLCDIPTDRYRGKSSRASSALLIGTSCGSLLLVDYPSARVHSKLLGRSRDEGDGNTHDKRSSGPIVHVSQSPPSAWRPLDVYGEEQGSKSKGRIAIIRRNGSVAIFATSFVVPSVESPSWLRASSAISDTEYSRSSSMTNGGFDMHRKQSLELVIEELPNHLGKDELTQPYIRAMWLSPVLLVLLRRPLHWDDEFFVGTGEVMSASSEVLLAQVWAVEDEECVDSMGTSIEYSNTALISELKRPIGDDDITKEGAHCTFTQNARTSSIGAFLHEPIGFSQDLIPSFLANCECSLSISFHRDTDSITICTQNATPVVSSSKSSRQFNIHSYCLIWNWKLNCTSLTVASSILLSIEVYSRQSSRLPSFFSRLHISKDILSGSSAVHVYEKMLSRGGRMIQKDAYELGVLSPQSSITHNGSLFVSEPSALMLLPESVLYPVLDSSSMTHNAHIRWEERKIPPSYLFSNGQCCLATVSSEGRSIAIAANRGLCILDLSRQAWSQTRDNRSASKLIPQWKLFGNVNDEQCFRVEHFVWWERNGNMAKCDDDENRSDDILIAVIQYSHSDSLHIVGWSRRRLGFGDEQLIVEASAAVNGHLQQDVTISCAGVPLHGLRSHSLSIIADPYTKDRALLLVTFDVPVTSGDSTIKYAVYQLQAHKSPQRKLEFVLSRFCASGSTTLASQSTTGIFLAGGSFSFQLDTEQEDRALAIEPNKKPIAVIGVTTMFQELVALCIFESKNATYCPLGACADSPYQRAKGLIVSYSKADSFSHENCSRITWNIAKNDGSVYCWSVPCENTPNPDVGDVQFALSQVDKSSIGEFCYLGNSSLWMNGASTNENEASIGPFNKTFGCILFAGQRSRKIMIPSSVDEFSASLHVSNCIVAPPRFTSMLFISFLSLATKATICGTNIGFFNDLSQSCAEFFRYYIQATLSRAEKTSALSSMRIIIFKVIELLSDAKFKDDNCTKWLAGKILLGEVVYAMRQVFDILTVTTFFLSVGRQLEPHQFNLMFPLPNECKDNVDIRTAEDLFSISHAQGSLSTVLSALPLFSCHRSSQKSVVQLVYHSLGKIEQMFELSSTFSSQVSGEEVKFVHQLFWFGVKLEDAIESLEHREGSESSYTTEGPSLLTSASDGGENVSNEDYGEKVDAQMCSVPQSLNNGSPKTGVLSKIVTHLFNVKHPMNEDEDEDAINDAASCFILSGFDSPVKSHLTTPLPVRQDIARSMRFAGSDKGMLLHNSSDRKMASAAYSDVTVAGAVAVFISHVIGFNRSSHHLPTTNSKTGWKTVSAVAHLLQGDRETVAITSAASVIALRISQTSTIKVAQQFIQGEGDGQTIILKFLRRLIFECAAQVQPEAAGVIFNLILLLLLRYDICEDVQACRTTLIIVGIVSGHLSGRISELIDLSLSSPMQSMYCDLLQNLPNIIN